MKRLSYLPVLLCLFFLSINMVIEAQQQCIDPFTGGLIACPNPDSQDVIPDVSDADGDGDGTSDSTDQCPTEGGPSWNSGCPTEPDADGDGTPDSIDQCPTEGGPDWNNGCPDGESSTGNTENLPALPQFPLDPDARDENGNPVLCYVATRTNTAVNLREETDVNSPVESILDPYEPEFALYRHVVIRGGLVEEWYKTLRGYAAAWVTRLSPQCEDSMSTWYFNYTREQMSVVVEGLDLSGYQPETVQEQNAVVLICPGFSVVLLPTDALTDCSGNAVSPSPDGKRFLCDDTWVEAYDDCSFSSLPAVLINESAQLLALSLASPGLPVEDVVPPGEGEITLLFGNGHSLNDVMFNPQPEPPADPAEDVLFVVLLPGSVPDVNIVGFNPQPEPPAQESNFGLLLGVNIVGFNPQPEPPAIITSFGEFSLNPTENGYQLINAEGIGVEIGLIDPEIISVDDLTLWPFPNMPDMTMWSVDNEAGGSTTIMCPGSEVSFNPQPEPPALDACFSITPAG